MKTEQLFIDDTQEMSVFEIMEKSAVLKESKHIDFIVIDYLQLIAYPKYSNSKKGKRCIEDTTRLIKILAMSLNIPILLLSSIPRSIEKKKGFKIPNLRHLAFYGSIEKFSEVILFLYRWEYYGFTESEDGLDLTNRTELNIAKNRNGPVTGISLKHDFKYGRFTEFSNSSILEEDSPTEK